MMIMFDIHKTKLKKITMDKRKSNKMEYKQKNKSDNKWIYTIKKRKNELTYVTLNITF